MQGLCLFGCQRGFFSDFFCGLVINLQDLVQMMRVNRWCYKGFFWGLDSDNRA